MRQTTTRIYCDRCQEETFNAYVVVDVGIKDRSDAHLEIDMKFFKDTRRPADLCLDCFIATLKGAIEYLEAAKKRDKPVLK